MRMFFVMLTLLLFAGVPASAAGASRANKTSKTTKVKKQPSESLGRPGSGRLSGSVRIPFSGMGYVINKDRVRVYGTPETVRFVRACMSNYRERFPRSKARPVSVGDLSSQNGGAAQPHLSHQSGRDVDIGYVTKPPQTPGLFDRTATAANLDREKQWVITKCFLDIRDTQAIFMHQSVVDALRDYVKKIYKGKRVALARKYLARFPEGSKAVLHPDYDHGTHMHVRFDCPKGDRRCVD